MEFESFEQALQLCMTMEDGSPEQREAMNYCLEHAPADLKLMLGKRLFSETGEDSRNGNCDCGCKGR